MIYLSSLSETASRASRYRTAWRTPHSIAASRRTSWPPGRRCVQSAHPRGAAPEHRNKCAAGWHICFDVLERLLAGEPIGRIVGPEAMKFGGWRSEERRVGKECRDGRRAGTDRRTWERRLES